jgi:hypothetical protein
MTKEERPHSKDAERDADHRKILDEITPVDHSVASSHNQKYP